MGKELEAYKNTPEGAFWEKAGELIKEDKEGYPAIEDGRLLRKELVQALRIENPCFTLQEIGNRAGITREAVRLILKGSDLETKSGNFGKKTIKVCETCNRIYRSISPESKYCSRGCYYKDRRVIVDCLECGKPMEKLISSVLLYPGYEDKYTNRGCFCNRSCSSIYNTRKGIIGFTEGHTITVGPEARKASSKSRRETTRLKGDLIEALKEESPNTKVRELAKRTKMSSKSIYRLLKSRDLPTK